LQMSACLTYDKSRCQKCDPQENAPAEATHV
jgi:hypothetical protein